MKTTLVFSKQDHEPGCPDCAAECVALKKFARANGYARLTVDRRTFLTLIRSKGWRNPQRIIDRASELG